MSPPYRFDGWTYAGGSTTRRYEGVLDRVEIKRGDVRQLPFADDSFDIVVSNFVLHEVNNRAEREQMLREMTRVLKQGGQLALVDFSFTSECVRVLQGIGIADAKRSRVGSFFSFWTGAVLNFGLVRTYRVTGRKPTMIAPRDGLEAKSKAVDHFRRTNS
jgi:ubiquinone/menaquinone biosynthesis C-methylase UbiE